MAASDKLRALEFTKDGTAKNPDSMYDLLAALPQLLAVVEAAEKGPRFSSKDLDRGGNWEDSWMEADALDAALTALEEALS